jgi:hypothetical protein
MEIYFWKTATGRFSETAVLSQRLFLAATKQAA